MLISIDEGNAAKAATVRRIKALQAKAHAIRTVQGLSGRYASKALIPTIEKLLPQYKRMRIDHYSAYNKQLYLFLYPTDAGYNDRHEIVIATEEDERHISANLLAKQLGDVRTEIAELQSALDWFDEYAAQYNNAMKALEKLRKPLYNVLKHSSHDNASKILWGH